MSITTKSKALSPGDLSFAQYYFDMGTPLPSNKLQAGSEYFWGLKGSQTKSFFKSWHPGRENFRIPNDVPVNWKNTYLQAKWGTIFLKIWLIKRKVNPLKKGRGL